MTDFIADLEAELLAAARRRRAGARARRRPFRLRPAPVLALAAVVAVAVTAALAIRSLPADDRPVPPAGGGVTVALPAAAAAAPCPGLDQRDVPGAWSAERGAPLLSVFGRAQHEPDGIPSLAADAGTSWIPATTVLPAESRTAGLEEFDADVHLIPSAGVREDPRCEPDTSVSDGPGVCLAVGYGGDGLAVRCFTEATIQTGRALALTGPAAGLPRDVLRAGLVHGIAPDGAATVTLDWPGGSVTVPVIENAYEAHLPGVAAGDRVRVRLAPPSCAPSRALQGSLPALRAPAGDEPPSAVDEAMAGAGARGAWRRWARFAVGTRDLAVWVVPLLPCDTARERRERVCLVAVGPGRRTGLLCRPADRSGRGTWTMSPADEALGIAGFAPAGTGRVQVSRDGAAPVELPVVGGVFGTVLPARFGSDGEGVELRYLPADDVAILNATRVDGLATRLGERLDGVDVMIGNFSEQDRERSTVYCAHDVACGEAERIAGLLGIADVELATPDIVRATMGEPVVVVAGRDLARSR